MIPWKPYLKLVFGVKKIKNKKNFITALKRMPSAC